MPITPQELAMAVRAAVAAGARDVHLHPKDGAGDVPGGSEAESNTALVRAALSLIATVQPAPS